MSWIVGDGNWGDPGNWSGNVVPNGFDTVRIGNLPGVHDSTVTLGAPGSGYDELFLSNGMTLDTAGGELVSFGPAHISGYKTKLIVRPAPGGINDASFIGELDLSDIAVLRLEDDAVVRLEGASKSASLSAISGHGTVKINSNIPFDNSGSIVPGVNGGLVINQGPTNNYPIDLDGSTEQGGISFTKPSSTLTINASGLADSFSDGILMGPSATLYMNVGDGWVADSESSIVTYGGGGVGAAQIAGEHMNFGGHIHIGNGESDLRILAPSTMEPTTYVEIHEDNSLQYVGETEIKGGTYLLSEGANIDFDGATTISGGTFNTFSNLSYQGAVNFNAPTTWKGNVVVNGVAHQFADAQVNGLTSIDAGVFDMDGGGNTNWQINHILHLYTSSVDSTLTNTFDGTIDITNNLTSRLWVELDNPADEWTMAGEMVVNGNALQYPIRVAGSRVRVTGELTFVGERSRFTADAIFDNPSVVSFASPATDVRMTGATRIASGATIGGNGTLRNAGSLLFEDGASLGDVALVNEGTLEVAIGPGVASVDRLTTMGDSLWNIEIGGYAVGSERDQLVVSGGEAFLDGMINVALIDLGAGIFAPQIGDEFVVLTTLSGINGTFANDPVSMADGLTYEWSVNYGTHDVTLLLQNITPEPSSLALLAFGTIVLRRRRFA
ncbi:MAG: PEP-CTERM sorting domain-containing protein [Phycisphaerales bacterium]|nr:PEP-CTERM sorting domain-containing protein [Phycisphaerales bacterium]